MPPRKSREGQEAPRKMKKRGRKVNASSEAAKAVHEESLNRAAAKDNACGKCGFDHERHAYRFCPQTARIFDPDPHICRNRPIDGVICLISESANYVKLVNARPVSQVIHGSRLAACQCMELFEDTVLPVYGDNSMQFYEDLLTRVLMSDVLTRRLADTLGEAGRSSIETHQTYSLYEHVLTRPCKPAFRAGGVWATVLIFVTFFAIFLRYLIAISYAEWLLEFLDAVVPDLPLLKFLFRYGDWTFALLLGAFHYVVYQCRAYLLSRVLHGRLRGRLYDVVVDGNNRYWSVCRELQPCTVIHTYKVVDLDSPEFRLAFELTDVRSKTGNYYDRPSRPRLRGLRYTSRVRLDWIAQSPTGGDVPGNVVREATLPFAEFQLCDPYMGKTDWNGIGSSELKLRSDKKLVFSETFLSEIAGAKAELFGSSFETALGYLRSKAVQSTCVNIDPLMALKHTMVQNALTLTLAMIFESRQLAGQVHAYDFGTDCTEVLSELESRLPARYRTLINND